VTHIYITVRGIRAACKSRASLEAVPFSECCSGAGDVFLAVPPLLVVERPPGPPRTEVESSRSSAGMLCGAAGALRYSAGFLRMVVLRALVFKWDLKQLVMKC